MPVQFLSGLQGAVRFSFGVGRLKLAHVDRIPFRIARLGEAGVRDRVVQQWDDTPPAQRDAVSMGLLGCQLAIAPAH